MTLKFTNCFKLTFVVGLLVFLAFGCQPRLDRMMMPSDRDTLERFIKCYKDYISKVGHDEDPDLARGLAVRKAVEALGYDYNKTFVYFMLDDRLKRKPEDLEIWATITAPRVDLDQALSSGVISEEAYKIAKEKLQIEGLNEDNIILVKALLLYADKNNSLVIPLHELRPLLPKGKEISAENLRIVAPLKERGLIRMTQQIRVRKDPASGKITIVKEPQFEILDRERLLTMVFAYDRLEAIKRQMELETAVNKDKQQ